MSRSEHTVDDMKVAALHTLDHALEQIGPLVRKVLHTDETYGVTELPLYLLGTRQHELDDGAFDRLPVLRGYLVGKVGLLAEAPMPFDKVFERHRRHHPHVHRQVLAIAQKQQERAKVLLRLDLLQVLFGFEILLLISVRQR